VTPHWLPAAAWAAVSAGGAVWLATPPSSRNPGRARHLDARWVLLGLATTVLGVPGALSALTAASAAAAVGALALWRRRLRRRLVEAGQARVLDFCQLVAAELSAGQPPGVALERAADEWPQLRSVAATFRFGGDLPAALRRAARAPGHGDLVLAAAAWQVAHTTGGGLTAAVTRVAADLRATQATRRVVQAELASARATARLMAGLPLFALLMGSGIGGDPMSFLFGTPWGIGCLAGGLACGFAGLWWIEAIADGVTSGLP